MIRFGRAVLTVVFMALLGASCFKMPDTGDQSVRRGILAYTEGKHLEAVQAFESALRKGVSDVKEEEVYTCLGNAYSELEEFEKSIAAHQRAIEINPDFHKAWVNLGVVYRRCDQFDDAERCYKKALELQPDYPALHASLGALYVFQGKYDEAVGHLEKAVALDKQLVVGWSNLAMAYAAVGRFSDAEAALKKAVMLGYPNGDLIKSRIDGLKSLADTAK